jgi:hypothetical protein
MRSWKIFGSLAGALVLLPLGADQAPTTCKLAIELVDADSGQVLPGLVQVNDVAGKLLPLEGLLSRGKGLAAEAPISRWSVLVDRATVVVPAAKLAVLGLHGLEWEAGRAEVDLTGKTASEVRLPLKRFHNVTKDGYRSANTHLHLMTLPRDEAERYLREIPRADGLDIVFLSYLERAGEDIKYVSNQFTREDLAALSRSSGVLFGNGEEHRHNFGAQDEGYGHVMLLDILKLIQPVSIGPGISKRGTDGLSLRRGIDAARADGATTIWCHNNWGFEDVPSWLTGKLDAQNIFDGGEHGSYAASFYKYLNVGIQVPFSTGTDWFQYDFSRVYAPAPGTVGGGLSEPLSVKTWLRSLAAGRSFITNGPLLELEANGRGLGGLVRLPGPAKLAVTGRAAGRIDFERLELLQNGKVIHVAPSRRAAGHFTAELQVEVEAVGPCWLALRTPPPPASGEPAPASPHPVNELGQPLFSHTSAIYVEVAGKMLFDRSVAEDLLREMEQNKALIGTKALFADDHERDHVLGVYEQAMAILKKRLAGG